MATHLTAAERDKLAEMRNAGASKADVARWGGIPRRLIANSNGTRSADTIMPLRLSSKLKNDNDAHIPRVGLSAAGGFV